MPITPLDVLAWLLIAIAFALALFIVVALLRATFEAIFSPPKWKRDLIRESMLSEAEAEATKPVRPVPPYVPGMTHEDEKGRPE